VQHRTTGYGVLMQHLRREEEERRGRNKGADVADTLSFSFPTLSPQYLWKVAAASFDGSSEDVCVVACA
jgi:hypothetical protein